LNDSHGRHFNVPSKPCKNEGHKRCLKVRTIHQPISKAIEACDK
jgi:hypothetical protein